MTSYYPVTQTLALKRALSKPPSRRKLKRSQQVNVWKPDITQSDMVDNMKKALLFLAYPTFLSQLDLLVNIISVSVSISCHTLYSPCLPYFPPIFCQRSILLACTKLLLSKCCRGYYLLLRGDIEGLLCVTRPLGIDMDIRHVVWVNEYQVVTKRLCFM